MIPISAIWYTITGNLLQLTLPSTFQGAKKSNPRELPDRYEQNLRGIFPDKHTGAFTFFSDLFHSPISEGNGGFRDGGGWVWTTFHYYQWDLNYANPAVFNRMAEEMLFLANQGVEVIRLDAVAFIWKELGTSIKFMPKIAYF